MAIFTSAMKQFRSILCVLLALLVMVSSTSFVVGVHKCKGEVKQVTLLSHADGCGHVEKLPPCHKAESKSCCENGDITHEASELNQQSVKVTISPLAAGYAILSTDVVISIVIPDATLDPITFIDHDIPIQIQDRSITNRVLLI